MPKCWFRGAPEKSQRWSMERYGWSAECSEPATHRNPLSVGLLGIALYSCDGHTLTEEQARKAQEGTNG